MIQKIKSDDPVDENLLTLPIDECTSECIHQVEEWVLRKVRALDAPIAIVIEGGHFNLGSGPDRFAEFSLRCGLTIGRRLISYFGRKIRVIYSVLIDDLGMDCDPQGCSVRTDDIQPSDRSLPPELEVILQRDRFVKRDRVIVATERHSRNRGLKQLKRLLQNKPDMLEDVLTVEDQDGSTSYVMKADDGVTVQVASHVESRWTIKCPLIMAAHYAELVAKVGERFGPAYAVAIVDFSDVSVRGKVARGAELALRALIPAANATCHCSILNVFWGDEIGEIFFTDSLDNTECLSGRAATTSGAVVTLRPLSSKSE
jgi:hypothetical protein